MGIATAKLELRNPARPDLRPVECNAFADIGALHLCIPDHIALQLHLHEAEKREVTLADGTKRLIPYVGPLHVRLETGLALWARWYWGTKCCWAPYRWKTWIWSFAQ